MRVVMSDLKLQKLIVVYPGTRRFELDESLIAMPLDLLSAELVCLSASRCTLG